MSGSGLGALPDDRGGREALTDVRVWSGGPPGCLGVVGRPFQMSGCCREALPVVREWSGDPTECPVAPSGRPVVVSWPSQMSESGREALPDVHEWSRGYAECPGVVWRPYRMYHSRTSGRDSGPLPDVQEWSEGPP